MNRETQAKWIDKQGHDRCWYYPDIFRQLCELFDVKITVNPNLPPCKEFKAGCERYQEEEYGKSTEDR